MTTQLLPEATYKLQTPSYVMCTLVVRQCAHRAAGTLAIRNWYDKRHKRDRRLQRVRYPWGQI